MGEVGGIFGDRTLYDIAVDFGLPSAMLLAVFFLLRSAWNARAAVRRAIANASRHVRSGVAVLNNYLRGNTLVRRRRLEAVERQLTAVAAELADTTAAAKRSELDATKKSRMLNELVADFEAVRAEIYADLRRPPDRYGLSAGWGPRSISNPPWEALWDRGSTLLTYTGTWAISNVVVTVRSQRGVTLEEHFKVIPDRAKLRVLGAGSDYPPEELLITWDGGGTARLRAEIEVFDT